MKTKNLWTDIKTINSSDENVKKYVFTKNNAVAESVLYKYPTYSERTVICCSTQSGCPVGCRFCGAGDNFVRSLTSEEISSQPIHLLNETGIDPKNIQRLQIMFMSMGEPMLNFNNLKHSLQQLWEMYPNAKLLISTIDPVVFKAFDELIELSKVIPTIGLQFSVHESTDENRKKLIPSNTMTLKQISQTGIKWAIATGRRPFFNYCVHEGNNKYDDAERLASLFNPKVWEATLSVICEKDESVKSSIERQLDLIKPFTEWMLDNQFSLRVFNPAGQDDIGGGFGQLWYFQEWLDKNGRNS
jgi:23S rRNA (adenine2503-C2)-methyltransferase